MFNLSKKLHLNTVARKFSLGSFKKYVAHILAISDPHAPPPHPSPSLCHTFSTFSPAPFSFVTHMKQKRIFFLFKWLPLLFPFLFVFQIASRLKKFSQLYRNYLVFQNIYLIWKVSFWSIYIHGMFNVPNHSR